MWALSDVDISVADWEELSCKPSPSLIVQSPWKLKSWHMFRLQMLIGILKGKCSTYYPTVELFLHRKAIIWNKKAASTWRGFQFNCMSAEFRDDKKKMPNLLSWLLFVCPVFRSIYFLVCKQTLLTSANSMSLVSYHVTMATMRKRSLDLQERSPTNRSIDSRLSKQVQRKIKSVDFMCDPNVAHQYKLTWSKTWRQKFL